MNMIVRHT